VTAHAAIVDLANETTIVGSSGSGPSTINVTGASATLDFDNTQTVTDATINLGSDNYDYLDEIDTANAGNQLLTLASSVTVDVVGNAEFVDSNSSGDGIVNEGEIDVTGSGTFYIYSTVFTNSGTIDVTSNEPTYVEPTTFTTTSSSVIAIAADSSLTIDPSKAWKNRGSIMVAGGASLVLGNTSLNTNDGEIKLGGGTLTSTGSLTNAAGARLYGKGIITAANFTNSGTIEASGGTLTLTNGVGGTGGLQIDAGANLVVGGAVASGATVIFAGANATLALNQPLSFGATIGGLAESDVIDLVGVTANGASVNGSNQLIVTGNGPVVTLQLGGSTSGFDFVPQSVSGGTDIVISAPTSSTLVTDVTRAEAMITAQVNPESFSVPQLHLTDDPSLVDQIAELLNPRINSSYFSPSSWDNASGFLNPPSFYTATGDKSDLNQCVALVQAIDPALQVLTSDWAPNDLEQVDIDGGNNSNLEDNIGVPIATFIGNDYPSAGQHAAIFLGYGTENDKPGFFVLDQYDTAPAADDYTETLSWQLNPEPLLPGGTAAENKKNGVFEPAEIRFIGFADPAASEYFGISLKTS
jgi:hypothetical protein